MAAVIGLEPARIEEVLQATETGRQLDVANFNSFDQTVIAGPTDAIAAVKPQFGEAGVRALAASDVVAVLLPASALFLARPMPPGRALVDAGAAAALATDFNPGSAFCESLPLVCSLAATQLGMAPEEALSACTVNAAHVLARSDRKGRLAEGYDADVVLLAADDWRHLAYHLAGPVVHTVIRGGESAWSSAA